MLQDDVFRAQRSQLRILERAAAAAPRNGLWIPTLAALPAFLVSDRFAACILSGFVLALTAAVCVVLARQLGWAYGCVRDVLAQSLQLPVSLRPVPENVSWNGSLRSLASLLPTGGVVALFAWTFYVANSQIVLVGFQFWIVSLFVSLPAAVWLSFALDAVVQRGMQILSAMRYNLFGLEQLGAAQDVELLKAACRRTSRCAMLGVTGLLLATCLLAGPSFPVQGTAVHSLVASSLVLVVGLFVATMVAALAWFTNNGGYLICALSALLVELESPSDPTRDHSSTFSPGPFLACARVLSLVSWGGVLVTAGVTVVAFLEPVEFVWIFLPSLWAVAAMLRMCGLAAVRCASGLAGTYTSLHAELV